MQLPPLPIHETLPELKLSLAKDSAVLAAPPGSGKTTIVPLALLEEPWLAGKKILILEPRRLATRAAAARMAFLVGEKVGQTVGYQIRFEKKVSKETRIEVVTEGILTRRLQNDPDLSGVGLIIFDEFHERSVHADLALALCLDLCQVKDDLRLLVMSATLDIKPLAALMGKVPVIMGKGQSHEVRVEYLERQGAGRISAITATGVRRVIREQQGDLLVFLPGIGEIKDAHRLLSADKDLTDILIVPLFGHLSRREQDRAILPDPSGRRRVILATSIAETSLTIEGIGCVVDSGWSRRPEFRPDNGLTRLTTVRVSKAAARQRAGRAGRLGPGYCLRLWTKGEHFNLVPFHPPEILSVDLAELALELALWGVSDAGQLRWLDPPRTGGYKQAIKLLAALGAIDDAGAITPTGKKLAGLPLHPRLGHMLLKGRELGQISLACDVAAILAERDMLRGGGSRPSADISLRHSLLELWRKKGAAEVNRDGGDPGVCKRIDRVSNQWRQIVEGREKTLSGKTENVDKNAIGTLLVYAYPERIARRRDKQRERYLLASGRGAMLPPADPLAACEYLVVPHLDAGKVEGNIFLAEGLDLGEIKRDHGDLISSSRQVYWDDATGKGKVVAIEQVNIGEIVVQQKRISGVDPEEIMQAIMSHMKQLGKEGLALLNWSGKVCQLQARVHCLASLQPEMDWPDFTKEHLLSDLGWLEPYLGGISRADQLKSVDLHQIFLGILGWEKQQNLDRDAPTRITVPSGSTVRINYQMEQLPVLAVRIQEVYGLTETPTICRGKVPLLLHLLSPARRPIQITSDLPGFWQTSYPEVKRELKGRYPKHFWPDDPLNAPATKGVKRNMKST